MRIKIVALSIGLAVTLLPISQQAAMADTSARPRKGTWYTIQMQTGTQDGAGTDARVELLLKGQSHQFGPMHMDDKNDNFERGRMDVFTKFLPSDLGTINEVCVKRDNAGGSPKWNLDYVNLQLPDKGDATDRTGSYHKWIPANIWTCVRTT